MGQSNQLMFGAPPPPMPPNSTTHHLQPPHSGNHLVASSNNGHSINHQMHQNHIVHPQQQSAGPTQQMQHCQFGARNQLQHVSGLVGSRPVAITGAAVNSCLSNPAGLLPIPVATQPLRGHPLVPPPYHFQPASNNGGQGQGFAGAPHNCNLQRIPPPIPFSNSTGKLT